MQLCDLAHDREAESAAGECARVCSAEEMCIRDSVKALLRIAVVYDIPIACNRASADFMLSSPLMRASYARRPPMAVER